MKRITKLLEEDELDIYAVKRDPMAKFALEIENGIFTWGGESKVENLKEQVKCRIWQLKYHSRVARFVTRCSKNAKEHYEESHRGLLT